MKSRTRGGNVPSRLFSLPPQQLAKVVQWLQEGVTLADIRQRLLKRFRFRTTIDALSRFNARHVEPQATAAPPLLDCTIVANGTPLRVLIEAVPNTTEGNAS